jgi:hypothetical protein
METDDRKIVVPKNASPYDTPLLPEAMQLLSDMALKLREHCFVLRQEMEPELIQFLPRVKVSEPGDA